MTAVPRYLLLATHVPPGGSRGGIVRYTVALARSLARRSDVELHVLAADGAVAFFREFLPDERVHRIPDGPTAMHSLLEWLGVAAALRSGGFDIVHGTKHIVPLRARGARRVLTVHDMILFDRSRDFPMVKRLLLRGPYRASIRRADVVVGVSRATRARLVDYVPTVTDRVAVVPLAASPSLTDVPATSVPVLEGRRFALVVGDASIRKNLALAVGTWEQVRSQVPGTVLAVVGPAPWGVEDRCTQAWDRLVAADALVPLHAIPDAALRWCYENAAAVLCPSLIEGFGLPTVEASALRAPVVTSDDPALCEASAGWGEPAAAWSCDDWVATVVATLNRDRDRDPPPSRTWDDVAAETVTSVLGGPRSPEPTEPRDRIGVSPFRASVTVTHLVAAGDHIARPAVADWAAAHRARGWKVEVAVCSAGTTPTIGPDTEVVVLHGVVAGRYRWRLRGRIPTVLVAGRGGPPGLAGWVREAFLARWTNALVLPARGASSLWEHLPVPLTRQRGDVLDADEMATVVVRARAWGVVHGSTV